MTILSELQRSVGRIEGKLDIFIDEMKDRDEASTALELRLRKVENRQHWYSGIVGTAGVVLGGLAGRLFHP